MADDKIATTISRIRPLGGHIRVGFENNLFTVNGSLASSDADLVRDTVSALQCLELRP
ncbi:3-keto-5-aminohexanoate cleavage protein [Rhizobium sp. BR 362]|uniref:3-keto-5-aminohexanoate cleavage protein n=1 Tax=Rhizobium sp. BR 362 TaxID=3040670 RepID=UPI002F3F6929